MRSVTYVHLFFAQHQVVFSNGIATESFYPGERAVTGLGTPQRDEFQRLFGDLVSTSAKGYGPPARALLRRSDLPRHIGALSLPRT